MTSIEKLFLWNKIIKINLIYILLFLTWIYMEIEYPTKTIKTSKIMQIIIYVNIFGRINLLSFIILIN